MTIDQAGALRELQQARPGDPFVAWRVDPCGIEVVATDGDHGAWTGLTRNRTERWATVLGDDAARVTALLCALESRAPIDGVTVHASAYAALPHEFRAPVTGHWCLWFLDANRITGAAHLVSVCCEPEFRGMGYARAVCSRLVVEADSDGSPVTILSMYAANAAGRALYSAIGFTEVRQYRSGLLTPRISVAVNAP